MSDGSDLTYKRLAEHAYLLAGQEPTPLVAADHMARANYYLGVAQLMALEDIYAALQERS